MFDDQLRSLSTKSRARARRASQPDRSANNADSAAAIASGRRAALDAFIAGDLVIGGDIRSMLAHREALEAVGDLFAELRDATTFD